MALLALYFMFYCVKHFLNFSEYHSRYSILSLAFIMLFGNYYGSFYIKLHPGKECNLILKKGEFVGISIFRYDDRRVIGFSGSRILVFPSDQIEQIRCGAFISK